MEVRQNSWEQVEQPEDPLAAAKYWMRKESAVQGGVLLIYQVILNVCVMVIAFAVTFAGAFSDALSGQELAYEKLMEQAMAASGWGYLLAIVLGFGILLLWRKPRFVGYLFRKKAKRMTVKDFFCLLALVMAPQVLAQLSYLGLLWLAEKLGMDPSVVDQLTNVDTESLSMFLYIGFGAPISEEILFRGVLQESIAPYGKKIAVLGSAILFGLYHANLIQTPYAILVGLVLGYTALEYHIVWAVALHMCNNLLFALLLPEALAFLPPMFVDMIIWALILGCFVASILILIRRWEEVRAWWLQDRLQPWQRKAFFGAPTVVVLMILCIIGMVFTVLLLLAQ